MKEADDKFLRQGWMGIEDRHQCLDFVMPADEKGPFQHFVGSLFSLFSMFKLPHSLTKVI